MRSTILLALAALLALPAAATARMNRNYLVPAYEPCPGSGSCNPPVRSSAYTFDSIILSSSAQPYTAPGKLALAIVVKGLKDGAGNPATGTLTLGVGASRITLLTMGIGTLGENSPLVPETIYNVPVQNGNGKGRFTTPDETPEHGLVVNSLGIPTLYDPDGKALATTGTQTKP